MPDVNIKYNGSSIATMNASGTKTMKTGGKYAAKDIVVEYTKPTPVLQAKTTTPSLSQQSITPDSGKDGLSSVTVQAITQQLLTSLDADFVAENIKKDVDLFGLLGTLEGGSGGGLTITHGTFTPTENILISSEPLHIAHGLGTVPSFFVAMVRNDVNVSSHFYASIYINYNSYSSVNFMARYYNSNKAFGSADNSCDATDIIISKQNVATYLSKPICWIAGVLN